MVEAAGGKRVRVKKEYKNDPKEGADWEGSRPSNFNGTSFVIEVNDSTMQPMSTRQDKTMYEQRFSEMDSVLSEWFPGCRVLKNTFLTKWGSSNYPKIKLAYEDEREF